MALYRVKYPVWVILMASWLILADVDSAQVEPGSPRPIIEKTSKYQSYALFLLSYTDCMYLTDVLSHTSKKSVGLM